MTENLDLTQLREVAEKVAFHEPDFKDLHEYLEALRVMQGELSGTTVLALIERVQAAEAKLERVREMHRPIPVTVNLEATPTDFCGYCDGEDIDESEYPCPTIRALGGGDQT